MFAIIKIRINDKNAWLKLLKDLVPLTIGTLLMALALNAFIANHDFAFGGVSGLAVIIEAYVGVPLGVTNLIISIPLFIFGAKFIGASFLFKSLVATCEVSLFLFLTSGLQQLTSHDMAAAIAGGILMGAGVGIVILGGGSTGGTDTAALIFNNHLKMPLSLSIMLIDYSVIILGAFLFGVNNALYSAIVVFGLAQNVKLVTQGYKLIYMKYHES